MKLSNLKAFLKLAVICLGLPSTASAVVTYTAGDIFMGFRQIGGTQDVLINIGNANLYKNPSSNPFVVPVGNIATDLANTFGPNWATDSTLRWAVVGTNSNTSAANGEPRRTLYATKPQTVLGVNEAPFATKSDAQQTNAASRLGTMSTTFLSYAGTSSGNNVAIQATSLAGAYANATNLPASGVGTSFNFWTELLEGNFANGASGTALDLFRNEAGLAGTLLGTFKITDAGVITFTSPVPEPASITLMAALGMLAMRRRRV